MMTGPKLLLALLVLSLWLPIGADAADGIVGCDPSVGKKMAAGEDVEPMKEDCKVQEFAVMTGVQSGLGLVISFLVLLLCCPIFFSVRCCCGGFGGRTPSKACCFPGKDSTLQGKQYKRCTLIVWKVMMVVTVLLCLIGTLLVTIGGTDVTSSYGGMLDAAEDRRVWLIKKVDKIVNLANDMKAAMDKAATRSGNSVNVMNTDEIEKMRDILDPFSREYLELNISKAVGDGLGRGDDFRMQEYLEGEVRTYFILVGVIVLICIVLVAVLAFLNASTKMWSRCALYCCLWVFAIMALFVSMMMMLSVPLRNISGEMCLEVRYVSEKDDLSIFRSAVGELCKDVKFDKVLDALKDVEKEGSQEICNALKSSSKGICAGGSNWCDSGLPSTCGTIEDVGSVLDIAVPKSVIGDCTPSLNSSHCSIRGCSTACANDNQKELTDIVVEATDSFIGVRRFIDTDIEPLLDCHQALTDALTPFVEPCEDFSGGWRTVTAGLAVLLASLFLGMIVIIAGLKRFRSLSHASNRVAAAGASADAHTVDEEMGSSSMAPTPRKEEMYPPPSKPEPAMPEPSAPPAAAGPPGGAGEPVVVEDYSSSGQGQGNWADPEQRAIVKD